LINVEILEAILQANSSTSKIKKIGLQKNIFQ